MSYSGNNNEKKKREEKTPYSGPVLYKDNTAFFSVHIIIPDRASGL